MKRFFIKNLSLSVNNSIKLTDDSYNYLVNVTRHSEGDKIIICDNSGLDYECEIISLNKKSATLKVLNSTKNINEPNFNLALFQALPKADKLELVTQKISELGLRELYLFESQFTIAKYNENKLDRLDKIAENASRQCGRGKMLDIVYLKNIKAVFSKLNEYDLVLLAYENSNNSLKEVFKNKNYKNIAVIVGSEGGFSENEIKLFNENVKNLSVVSLGNRILRAETAGIVLPAVIMYEMGEIS